MRRLIITWLNRVALAVLLALIAVFAVDYLSIRFQLPNHRQQFGTVRIKPYYAVRLKDGKTEFMFADPQDETCSYSLFPQLGYRPCWYVTKHKTKRIDIK